MITYKTFSADKIEDVAAILNKHKPDKWQVVVNGLRYIVIIEKINVKRLTPDEMQAYSIPLGRGSK